jgi:very-short-patch-repair endonuclease
MPVKNIVRGQHVSYEMHERAKELRREMTPAEKILWERLRADKLNGLHFRRQQIIDGYLADFYCHQHSLIVELDGGIHDLQKDYDAERAAYLIARGFHIIRFKNEEISGNLSVVLKRIVEACSLCDSPFPAGKGAGEIGQENRDD